jgi:hypothetical protein
VRPADRNPDADIGTGYPTPARPAMLANRVAPRRAPARESGGTSQRGYPTPARPGMLANRVAPRRGHLAEGISNPRASRHARESGGTSQSTCSRIGWHLAESRVAPRRAPARESGGTSQRAARINRHSYRLPGAADAQRQGGGQAARDNPADQTRNSVTPGTHVVRKGRGRGDSRILLSPGSPTSPTWGVAAGPVEATRCGRLTFSDRDQRPPARVCRAPGSLSAPRDLVLYPRSPPV